MQPGVYCAHVWYPRHLVVGFRLCQHYNALDSLRDVGVGVDGVVPEAGEGTVPRMRGVAALVLPVRVVCSAAELLDETEDVYGEVHGPG